MKSTCPQNISLTINRHFLTSNWYFTNLVRFHQSMAGEARVNCDSSFFLSKSLDEAPVCVLHIGFQMEFIVCDRLFHEFLSNQTWKIRVQEVWSDGHDGVPPEGTIEHTQPLVVFPYFLDISNESSQMLITGCDLTEHVESTATSVKISCWTRSLSCAETTFFMHPEGFGQFH